MKKPLLLSFFLFLTLVVFGQNGKLLAFQSKAYASTTESFDQQSLTIYPNPFTSYIKINDESEVVRQVVVFNLLGKKMKSFVAAQGERYNVSDLPRGIYLVQLYGNRNKVIKTQRINKR